MHSHARRFVIFLSASFSAAILAPAVLAGPTDVLPPASAVPGWKAVGKPRVYNSATLYDLVNGEADAILAYDFRGCAHGEYAPASSSVPVLTIDVYDMGDPLNAFGMFGSDRLGQTPVKIGAEGVKIGSSGLNFWKGRYVVRTALVGRGAVTPANQAAQRKFANASAARISGGTTMPAQIKALPPGYKPGTQRYVRKNVAGQAFLVNAVTARYSSAGTSAELFVAKYPSATAAKTAYGKWKSYAARGKGLAPLTGVGEEGFSVKDPYTGTVVGARKGAHIIGVIRTKDVASAKALASKAAAKL